MYRNLVLSSFVCKQDLAVLIKSLQCWERETSALLFENNNRMNVEAEERMQDRVWFSSLKGFEFEGSLLCTGTKVESWTRSGLGHVGFFCVHAYRNGSIVSVGPKQPFTGYPFQSPGILTLLHAEACKKVACAHAQQEAKDSLLRERFLWRHISVVEQWFLQYKDMLGRYKFLVLKRSSRIGKATFVRTIAPNCLQTLQLNSIGDNALDLRGFRGEHHGAIIFHEI